MITIFCDFYQFAATKLAFFLKKLRYDPIDAEFRGRFYCRKYFKIVTSVADVFCENKAPNDTSTDWIMCIIQSRRQLHAKSTISVRAMKRN
jgi:hypothetical protein